MNMILIFKYLKLKQKWKSLYYDVASEVQDTQRGIQAVTASPKDNVLRLSSFGLVDCIVES